MGTLVTLVTDAEISTAAELALFRLLRHGQRKYAQEAEAEILGPVTIEVGRLSCAGVRPILVRDAITPEERTRRARLPAVVQLTRALRVREAQAAGNPHRGMIPGGEDETAYLAGVQECFDPDPVWRQS